MNCIETNKLSLGYGETLVIQDLNLEIPKGKITVFIGSNGCGKSTLLRSIARLLPPKSGNILLDGKNVNRSNTKEIAKKMSVLPQGPTAPDELTVFQLIKLGRYPHQNWLNQWSEEDEHHVWEAMRTTELEDLAQRPVESLSGGQRQRAWIAMTLAQNTEILLLDEPTTFLDLGHQIEVLDILYDLNRKKNRTIIMVLHDLNLAARYADHIVAVANRTVIDSGSPNQVIHRELIKKVFHMDCLVTKDPLFHTPMCIPYGKGMKSSQLKVV